MRTLRRRCPPALPSTRPTMTVAMIPDSCSRSAIRYVPYAAHDRDRHLDQVVVGEPHQALGDEPGDEPDHRAGHDRHHERDDALRERHGLGERPRGDREQHDAGAVVEQALGLDDRRQPGGRVEPLEQRDDGDRVGGREDRAQDERERRGRGRSGVDTTTATTAAVMSTPGAARNAIIAERPAQLADVDLVGGLEHEARQQDREDQLGRDVDLRRPGRRSRAPRPATTSATEFGIAIRRATSAMPGRERERAG